MPAVEINLNQNDDRITQLFQTSKAHRLREQRVLWIKQWISSDSEEITDTRLRFLKSVWEESTFRPFDTVPTAEQFLKQRRFDGFIIRLSTSKPGAITISFKSKGKINHTRFFLNDKGEIAITGSNSKSSRTFPSLVALAEWFTKSSYVQPKSQTAYISLSEIPAQFMR